MHLGIRMLPASLAALERIAEERGVPMRTLAQGLLEDALEALGEPRCRGCGVDIAGMGAYRRGEPRQLCDVCETERMTGT